MGFRIKEVRKRRKMSQEELATKSNVSRGTICALESGNAVVVTSKTLVKLAKALDVTVEEIFFS